MKRFILGALVALLSLGLAGCNDSTTEPTSQFDVDVRGSCVEGSNNGVVASVDCEDRSTVLNGDPRDVDSVGWVARNGQTGRFISDATGELGKPATIFNVPCEVQEISVKQTVQLKRDDSGSQTVFESSRPIPVAIRCPAELAQ